ncbi:hypothetical protein [Paenibacillus protaetiae]|uniref:RNA polymerase subunit sigma n=1 Tax=Paenibacillus protaetiae TaxID=2509456 RepID=A0A4V0YEW4_9BACL|nr:hypothetical protein [Paenibacillus protaetiae]QAY65621.1 hypothetical protein ET464_03720 [Paenibacillus protaetiae]
MTYQPIDLQLSIPRTPEQGSVQAQAVHRSVAEQQQLAAQTGKETERLRTSSTPVEQSGNTHIRSGEERQKQAARPLDKRTAKNAGAEEEEKPAHPFKGHHIDISL